jgi:hypothetical protein
MARCILTVWLCTAGVACAGDPPQVDFNRDVRPILADNCFTCHGPDEAKRKAELRLDVRSGLVDVVRPGKPGESELIRRITSNDEAEVMPPPKTGKKLSPAQRELLCRWVEQGADWSEHWAFVRPTRPMLPTVANVAWVRNPIDHFVLARLERERLTPSAEADRATLLRRLTLDLTGLPPTPGEVEAFVADPSPDAYAKQVRRLLASPHYGERMALDWLDAARFADTHGYHIDSGRDMTRWRDWVINAFNRNLPFDRFTVEQLAGDLLPHATVDQKVASGFHRNHMINYEGGAIPEEYHAAYVTDRVNTTGAVWLGLTVGCAQCHDHKYDPLTQKEYYQLFAFFNNVPEQGLDGRTGNAAPLVRFPTAEQEGRLNRLASEISQLETRLKNPDAQLDAAQVQWEHARRSHVSPQWLTLTPAAVRSKNGAALDTRADKSVAASGPNPAQDVYELTVNENLAGVTGIRLEALTDASHGGATGRAANGNFVLTEFEAEADGRRVRFAAAEADYSQTAFEVARAIDGNPATGWAVDGHSRKENRTALFIPAEPIAASALVVRLRFDSEFAAHAIGRFRLSVTETRDPKLDQSLPPEVAAALARPADQRVPGDVQALRDYFRRSVSTDGRRLYAELRQHRAQRDALVEKVPSAMVMQELAKPRDTHLIMRGQYDQLGAKVSAATPAWLPALPKDAPTNRLGLARWIVSSDNPLTARVIVNRYWQMYFGTGLVKTAEDVGTQGERPSHPELLDWLANEFVRSGWDVKAMQRLIVTSATYRQSSVVTPQLLVRDPDNRLLARQSRLRLPAEVIRDQALAVSGLLNRDVGGASVSPYNPPGLWEDLSFRTDNNEFSAQTFKQSRGRELYRRGMYTFWKRTSPPASLSLFDAPDRETCTVRRARTNTPLQALALLNDPTYVEASRKLAERLLAEAATDVDRIEYGMKLVVARPPTDRETAVLLRLLWTRRDAWRRDSASAERFLRVGESPRNAALPPAELAAWAAVAGVILNLDEAVTRN